MKEPGKYERMAIVREIEKLNEIKYPSLLKKQHKIVQEIKNTYEPMGLYEQMVKDAEQKWELGKDNIKKPDSSNAAQEFLDELRRINAILKDDKLLEKERYDYANKLGRYAKIQTTKRYETRNI